MIQVAGTGFTRCMSAFSLWLARGHGSIVAGRACARLDLGPFSMLGGDSTSVDAASLVAEVTVPRIFVDCSSWHALVREHHKSGEFTLVRRTQFSPDELEDKRLQDIRRVPRGKRPTTRFKSPWYGSGGGPYAQALAVSAVGRR